MSATGDVSLIVVGSIGIDTIETPHDRREEILGGSASYACASASFFTRCGMVGVVGTDFPDACRKLYDDFKIDQEGLQTVEGKTFRWSGVYEENMNNRTTLSTDLNVFADFSPAIPEAYKQSPFLFLANISPDLQEHVLDQVEHPEFVLMDTMDLWINTTREALVKVIKRVDMLTVNESEARQLTGEHNLINAANALLKMGPRFIMVKKGEHGSMLFSENNLFIMPAYPVADVVDPTGAGDSFAGGFMGALAAAGEVTEAAIRKAMVYGTVVASYGVEAFSLDRLEEINPKLIEERAAQFREMTRVQ